MKIGIAGTRGIPAAYGGFETFAEAISVGLIQKGFKVTVYCDKDSTTKTEYKGVKLRFLPLKKSTNQVIYFFLSLIAALRENDVVLVTSTGAAYFYWVNKLFFRKVIITNSDGIESKRSKWSFWQKQYLKYSEIFAMKYSSVLVADSFAIADYLKTTYKKTAKIYVIEYGAPVIEQMESSKTLAEYGLIKDAYFIIVARLEPENNIEMMVQAFSELVTNIPLVIIGELLPTNYVQIMLNKYKSDNVRFIGGIYDQKKLSELRFHALAYLHGHSVGGTNPSLLEAMGCGNICICHDNPFNREVTANDQLYFGNRLELSEKLQKVIHSGDIEKATLQLKARQRIKNYYSWPNITSRYAQLLGELVE